MEICYASKSMDKKELYLLTKSQSAVNARTAVDREITVDSAIIFTEPDREYPDKLKTVLAMNTDAGILRTVSPTFINSFSGIVECFGEFPLYIRVCEGTSKNGRKFIFADV